MPEQDNTPSPEAPDIQELAQKNADEAAKHVEQGRSAPNIPATPENLARFQNRDSLPEEERKALEPTGGTKEEEEEEEADPEAETEE